MKYIFMIHDLIMKYYILLLFWNCVLFNKLIDINRYYYSLRETI